MRGERCTPQVDNASQSTLNPPRARLPAVPANSALTRRRTVILTVLRPARRVQFDHHGDAILGAPPQCITDVFVSSTYEGRGLILRRRGVDKGQLCGLETFLSEAGLLTGTRLRCPANLDMQTSFA